MDKNSSGIMYNHIEAMIVEKILKDFFFFATKVTILCDIHEIMV